MKNILDIPPVWLVMALLVAWCQGRFFPLGHSIDHPLTRTMGGLLVGAGLILIGAAAFAFWRARTTIVPHQTPTHLLTTGIFARTRNPIYLADALILTGLILCFDALPSLVLVPLFVWWIERHFIVHEEDRMRHAFPVDFPRYALKVGRWVNF
ncbi:methyltransferase family protein [Tateyamaria sp.]|uniref:methyltransferase family protein n=1 Tax=Tateyamaria sp. TaxID=1929288 RepID=UPI0032A0ACE6